VGVVRAGNLALRFLLELALFGAAAAALAAAGRAGLAVAFGLLVLVNEVLVTALDQRVGGAVTTRRRPGR
jgi:hypothetical protein